MKKIFILFALFAISVCGCTVSKFDGSKTGDENHFDIEFKMLNTEFSHELKMQKGEDIEVAVEALSGNISVVIENNQEDIYRGSNMKTSTFKVNALNDGTYTVTVSGENAKGHVTLTRK